jgi:hypothetical protein
METATASGVPMLLFVMDAVTEEKPEYTATVTEHPVEDGPEVTDHIQLKNPTVSIKGTVSGTPIDLQTTVGTLLAGGIAAVTSSQIRKNLINSGLQQAAGLAGARLFGQSPEQTGGNAVLGASDAIARNTLLDAYNRRTGAPEIFRS